MLRIEHLSKHYRQFVLDCSMDIMPGRITGLIGTNGSGKTTTFKAILGLIHRDGGRISFFGKDIQELDQQDKQRIGVTLADSFFSEYLTIKDMFPVLTNLYASFDKEYFLSKCQQFSLPLDVRILKFSTGMKAKLKVLITMSHQADLLILDEPTAGLDVLARDELQDMIRDYMLEREDASILMSSHISSDLEGLCDDLYMIHDGQIIFHEETDRLLDEFALLKVDEGQYLQLDKQYVLRVKKEEYGYCCLTDQKQFYLENYPMIVIEKVHIDELITLMLKGEKI